MSKMEEINPVQTSSQRGRAGGRPPSTPQINPTVGVKSDFEKLLTKFTETKSVRYEEFASIWRDLKMSLIFSGRQSDVEVREFVEDCFNIALTFLMTPYNFQVRVGALYIIYGLYWKQPCRPIARIRITLEQWKEMTQLMEEVRQQKHLDAEYVYTMLEVNNAFTFVATPIPMYPHMRDVIDDDTKLLKRDALAMLAEQKSILSEILEPDNIDQLSAIHEHYHRLKCLLNTQNSSQPKPSMDVIKPSLVQYITKSVAAYEEKRKVITGKKPRKRHDSRDSGQTTTSESEPESDVDNPEVSSKRQKKKHNINDSSTGNRRAEIKARAFAGVENQLKSRRHRQVVKDSQSEDNVSSTSYSSPSPKKKRKLMTKTHIFEHDTDTANDNSRFGEDLKNSLLSMPVLHEIEEVKVTTTKKNEGKKFPKGGKRKGTILKTPPKDIYTSEENKTPKTSKKGKGTGKKSKSKTDPNVSNDANITPDLKRKNDENETMATSVLNSSVNSALSTSVEDIKSPSVSSDKRKGKKRKALKNEPLLFKQPVSKGLTEEETSSPDLSSGKGKGRRKKLKKSEKPVKLEKSNSASVVQEQVISQVSPSIKGKGKKAKKQKLEISEGTPKVNLTP